MSRVAIGNPTAQTGRRIVDFPDVRTTVFRVPIRLTFILLVALAATPLAAEARAITALAPPTDPADTGLFAAQRDGMSLNEAVESVRRRADVERVLSAETKVEGGREVHHIKVMTKNGTVRTVRVNGRRR